jgi:phosphoadenosine phosphosulfate reductase
MQAEIITLQKSIKDKSPDDALRIIAAAFPGKVTFSTSLGYEDQVITDFIFSNKIPISIFTLDTGRLFSETYLLLNSTRERYQRQVHVYSPQTNAVEELLTKKGPVSFYESIDNRKECCFIRKVEPLKRALKEASVWVTGIRADQSTNRKEITQLEWDEENQLIKFHPILNWTLDDVKKYIRQHNIPYNVLHDKGFVSIGCAPCTRAIKEGEDFRAGRWWWEDNNQKECGLHSK